MSKFKKIINHPKGIFYKSFNELEREGMIQGATGIPKKIMKETKTKKCLKCDALIKLKAKYCPACSDIVRHGRWI